MSFLTFSMEMLDEKLFQLDFHHRHGTTWVKVTDEGIYMSVTTKKIKVSGPIYATEICFSVSPICTPVYNMEYQMSMLLVRMKTLKMIPATFDSSTSLLFVEKEDERYDQMVNCGRESFSYAVEPLIASAYDLEGCYKANWEANFLSYSAMEDITDRSLYNPVYTNSTFSMFFTLCKLRRYDEAVDLLKNCGEMSSICGTFGSMSGFLAESRRVSQTREMYIKMVEDGRFDEFNEIMDKCYEENCKKLKTKFKLDVKKVMQQ